MTSPKQLWPHQVEALLNLRNTVAQGVLRVVIQAPTGAGKTRVAADIVQGAQRKGNKLAFVVSSLSLIDQAVEMFYAEGIRDIGVIQAEHRMTDWSKPVQVCSIDTIRSRKAYPEARVVVIDECHRLHKTHVKWMGRLGDLSKGEARIVDAAPGWEKVPFIGLSATPWTKGLGKYFETLLVMSTTRELIDQGYLSKFKVYAADHPDLSEVKTVAGDYHEGQLTKVMQDKTLVANVIETYKARWNKDKTLLFGVDCAHARMLQERFHDAGISCAYQDANTPDAERAAIKRGFHTGQYKVVANVGTLTTGVDWDVRCLILARPTKSEMLFVQIIGRALRTADGKDHALILDHTDTTSRLGFVTDIHHEQLDSGKLDSNKGKAPSPALPKPCSECGFLIPPRMMKCPECGHERKIQSHIRERDGQLVEMTGDRRPKKTSDRLFPYTREEKLRFFAQLRGYGIERGYKPTWAKLKFLEKFGHWPEWGWENHPHMIAGAEVRNYARSRAIAWARQQRGSQNAT